MTRKTRSKLMYTRDPYQALREIAARIDSASGSPTFTADESEHLDKLIAEADRTMPGPFLVLTRRRPPMHDSGSWSEHATREDAHEIARRVQGRVWHAATRGYETADELVITLEGGLVQRVTRGGNDVAATVHDYDVEGSDPDADDVFTDEDGDEYLRFYV